MQTFRVPIDSIHLDPANVRSHDDRNLAAIKASLARFGQQKPIVVDADDIVRAGNGTLRAARLLGWTEIDIVRSELKGSDATSFAIADNRTSDLSSFEYEPLAETLEALRNEDPELFEATGFNSDELDAILETLGTDIIEAEEWPERDEPETKTVTLRYGREDVEAILLFAGMKTIEDLESGRAGKAILERIREVAQG